MRAQRLRGAAVAAFTTAAVLAAPIVTANAAHAGTDEGGSQVSSAVFQWAMNDESGSAGYAPGTCNFFSAMVSGNSGGGQWPNNVQSGSDGEFLVGGPDQDVLWRPKDGNVSILKPNADGQLVAQTWANKCLTRTGARTNTRGAVSESIINIEKGSGTVDPTTNSASIKWVGSWTVVYYSGMTYWSATNPVLEVTNGQGAIKARVSGFGASMQDPDAALKPLQAREVTLATLKNVAVTKTGITVTPEYKGVEVKNPEGASPQTRTGENWGSWPADFVAFQGETGQHSYWYSTGSSGDARKPALPVTITWPQIDDAPAPQPGPTQEPTPAPTADPSPAPTAEPTPAPTADPSPAPTAEPTPTPTGKPTTGPSAKPSIEVSPYQDIDPTVKTVVTVKGKDFTSGSIQNGVYVVLMDEKIWKPGEYMNAKGDEGAITSAWVTPDQLEAGKGSFTVKLTIPENTLDRTHTYYIGTMAAHGLALSDRSLDHAEKITFKAIDYDPNAVFPVDSVTAAAVADSGRTNMKVDWVYTGATPSRGWEISLACVRDCSDPLFGTKSHHQHDNSLRSDVFGDVPDGVYVASVRNAGEISGEFKASDWVSSAEARVGAERDPNPGAGKGQWIQDSFGWWYRHSDGSYTTNGTEQIDGVTYRFNEAGYMVTGWTKVGGQWFYYAPSGAQASGWTLVGGSYYYLDPATGAMATGWQQVDGAWYYLGTSGAMDTGWQRIGGAWYHLGASGAMDTGWTAIGGSWYYFAPSGQMATGWVQDSGKWYYLDPSTGAMATGWQQVDGAWYYLFASGEMATGSHWIDGVLRVFDNSGAWVR